jgi:hypothetical protein
MSVAESTTYRAVGAPYTEGAAAASSRDPIVTDEEMLSIIEKVEQIRERIIEKNLAVHCYFNNINLLDSLPIETASKMRLGVLTGSESHYYGIPYLYHVVCLAKKEDGWHVIDPVMGLKITCKRDFYAGDEFTVNRGEMGPVACKADTWLRVAFDAKEVEKSLSGLHLPYCHKMEVLQFSSKKEIEVAGRGPTRELMEPHCVATDAHKPILNLSQMIEVFSGSKDMEEALTESSSRSFMEVARAVNVAKVDEYFGIEGQKYNLKMMRAMRRVLLSETSDDECAD